MLHLQLLVASLLTVVLSTISSAGSELEFASNSNRRVVDNTENWRAENRTKRLRQVIVEKVASNSDDDEDRKTLAQQVADGKYGLIQKELFANPVERPGIISYEVNPEVPKDNVNNLGGLRPEEIWLAENHLLVLRGGVYTNKDPNGNTAWPPIDNYIAPQRQVKIPPNPKVPPPFPVQLKDGGPIEYLKGENGTGGPIVPFFDPRFSPPGLFPFPPFPHPGENVSIPGNPGNSSVGNGFNPPFPFPPIPGIGLFPPAAAFLPPPGNLTELDEDDPSIYYPPPYDFVYPKDNSSFVPPGPLVPGIILPPPPNFFSSFENKTKPSNVKQHPSWKLSKLKPRPSQFAQDTATKVTRPTKPPKKTVVVSIVPSKTSSTTSTIPPLIITTTDATQNEIIPPATLPPNTPVGEWVPIPAPRPFYVSEINGLRSGVKMKLKPENETNIPSYPLFDNFVNGYDYTPPQKKGRLFPAPAPPSKNFRPIYVPPIVDPTTIEPPSVYTSTYNAIGNTETHYPFEQQQYNSYRTRNRPSDYFGYNGKTSEAPTAELYNDVSLPGANYQQSHFDYYRQKLESSTTSSTPVNFYYYDQNRANLPNANYQFSPIGSKFNPVKSSGPYRRTTQQPHSIVQPSTEKPPVFEYSYSAPGYGTVESPKVGTNFVTTPKPLSSTNINFPTENDQRYSYIQYHDSRKPIYLYHETTPSHYNLQNYKSGSRENHRNPTTNQQDLGLDEITQKYFTIFGEKLNGQTLRQSTTSAPLTNYFYNPEGGELTRSKAVKQQKVQFPQDDYYSAPVEPYNYKVTSDYHQPSSSNRHSYPNQQLYSNYYGMSSPQNGGYDEFANDDRLVAPGHPLRTDINVNYKRRPLSAVSDAEYITSGNPLQTDINFKRPLPTLNQDDGLVAAGHSLHSDINVNFKRRPSTPNSDDEIVAPGHPLHSDINVNYKRPSQPLDPDAELVDPTYLRSPNNAFISYQLPGSGGHFYFLTPQTVKNPFPPPQYQQVDTPGYYKRNAQPKSQRQLRSRQPSR